MSDRSLRGPDWRRPEDYVFTERLSGARWAWEFLRRNPEYRREWAAFWAVWQALEADYGRPPDRDFCAWKRDPRAWVRVPDGTAGDCRVDEDKVLLECAFGARWGFHKFPPDPADDDPVGEGRLTWRPIDQRLEALGPGDTDWLGTEPAKIAVGFDLRRDLPVQLERAKRLLQMEQRRRVRAGDVVRLTVASRAGLWQRLLRLLDADAAGADIEEARRILDVERPLDLLAEAKRLSEGGYRELAALR
jgi:hypothetical protein